MYPALTKFYVARRSQNQIVASKKKSVNKECENTW